MKLKIILPFIFSAAVLLSFTSCNKPNNDINIEETTIAETTSKSEVNSVIESTTYFSAPQTTQQEATTAISETTTSAKVWTDELIVSEYKKAAEKSDSSVKSKQSISLNDISFGDDAVNSVIKLIKPVISSVVSGNSTEFDGLTGGYQNLTASDIQKAEAYSDGSSTIIKMTLKEQTDYSVSDINSGTVGHAISVVGDISGVMKQLNDSGLPVKINNDSISMFYTNPVVKVKINENGIIENGTWSYTVTIHLGNFKVGNTTVENSSVVINNEITVNGGFAE